MRRRIPSRARDRRKAASKQSSVGASADNPDVTAAFMAALTKDLPPGTVIKFTKEGGPEEQDDSEGEDPHIDDYFAELLEDMEIDPDLRYNPPVVENTGVRLRDLGGIDSVKKDMNQIIRFLKDPDRYRALGAKLPKGVLLKGVPGVGKTMIAKAMAQESGVPVIAVSATEFDAHLHGIGPARMRFMMMKAKLLIDMQRERGVKNPSCMIFIDELDVIGASRGEAKNVHQATMMELARLMDGFEPSDGIIVMAATNRPEILDPALVRPGRFDWSLEVPSPDMKGRLDILRKVLVKRKMPLAPDVDLEEIARGAFGFVGADLDHLANEAALTAASKNKKLVGKKDFEQARQKVIRGQRVHLDMTQEEKERTALHEAGHAVTGLRMEARGGQKLRDVTILPHVGSLGTTYFGNDHERLFDTRESFMADLVMVYGGRSTELAAYGEQHVSSGASGDIDHATRLSWRMVARYGFNKNLGLISFGKEGGRYLEQEFSQSAGVPPAIMEEIHREMKHITDEAEAEARKIVAQDFARIVKLAKALVKVETLNREAIIRVTGIRPQAFAQKRLGEMTAPTLA